MQHTCTLFPPQVCRGAFIGHVLLVCLCQSVHWFEHAPSDGGCQSATSPATLAGWNVWHSFLGQLYLLP
eukprot:scaffold197855_cov14-Tisochrysis_lutea.AAC.2